MLKVDITDFGYTEKTVLKNLDFTVEKGKHISILGESGCGKSPLLKIIYGLLHVENGTIFWNDNELLGPNFNLVPGEPFIKYLAQDFDLMPYISVADNIGKHLSRRFMQQREERIKELLDVVDMTAFADVHVKLLSGGQKQRVMIAMAIACKPKILIADEPTTALDVTVQKEILLLLKSLQQETEMSIIFISHDLALVSEISDRVVVMYQGKIVEQNSASALFLQPKETYTKALLASKPSTTERLKKLPTVKNFLENTISTTVETKSEREKRHQEIYAQSPLLEVVNVEKEFVSNPGLFQPKTSVRAVNDVSFKIYEGETLGLVGESGCGKSTLGNVVLQLDKATAGKVLYRGNDITKISKTELRKLRKEIQLIFQDPFSSLNPRIPVGKAIMEPMEVHRLYKNNKERKQKTLELLHRVGLDESHFNRYPHEFSGGQRQRIGIARTIAVEPKLIVCDESVSALDISVQAQVLNLLNELKDKFGFTYIFISHDLAVVKYMADQLLVMNQGKIVEQGDADQIYANPEKEYTQKLIDAIPKGI